jgi:MraZ protein
VKNSKMASERVEKKTVIFFGEYIHSIDPQRRVAVPKTWRIKGVENKFYLLPGRHKSLQIIPIDVFGGLLDKIRGVSFADPSASVALGQLGSMAQECECDGQGRIGIPQRLMDYAGLGEKAVLVGALSTAQIWSEESWRKVQGSDEQVLDVIQKLTVKSDSLADILKGVKC